MGFGLGQPAEQAVEPAELLVLVLQVGVEPVEPERPGAPAPLPRVAAGGGGGHQPHHSGGGGGSRNSYTITTTATTTEARTVVPMTVVVVVAAAMVVARSGRGDRVPALAGPALGLATQRRTFYGSVNLGHEGARREEKSLRTRYSRK